MVTEYLGNTGNGCKYNYNKLKDVLYLVSAEHVKDVHIDNGEAYISGLTELPLRINGFNIQFTEETSLDERYKFQKKITLSMNGYVSYKIFEGKYYAILESEDGTYFMVNVDFPSRITHTFNLSKGVNQTDFTFACLSNFPTLKLDAQFEAKEPVCLGFRVNGIQSLELIEKEKARLDVENKTVISTEDFKKIEYLGDSCSFSEVYDGFKVTDTIEFQIALDAYKPSWQYNLLEFLDNKYSAIIIPKGNDNKFYPGFNFGLEPSYVISTASQRGESDIITVTLTESSSYGTTAANDWDEDQSTETRWRWVKQVDDIICYECIGIRRARYLVRQQVDTFGNPTGDYQVMEGYESQYPNFNIVGTFTTEHEFDNLDCDESGVCGLIGNMPNAITFNAATCHTYSLRTSCPFEFRNIPANITVTPSAGNADTDYNITICNSATPSSTPSVQNMTLSCCQSNRNISISVQTDNNCVRPETQYINCLGQQVRFTYDGNCRLSITSAPGLTYSVSNNTVTFTVPRNNTTSAITYTIQATNCDCSASATTFHIQQDKVYEQWVTEDGYICDGNDSYTLQRRYTGTSSSNMVATDQTRKGTLITSGDTRCSSSETTRWDWDGVNYYCWQGDKYKAVFKYVSYDGGTTWTKTNNTRLGDMVESASTFCSEPVQYKWELTDESVCQDFKLVADYKNGSTYVIKCDNSNVLTSGETHSYSSLTSDMTDAVVGSCITEIGPYAFRQYSTSGQNLSSVTLADSVKTIGNSAFMDCFALTEINLDNIISVGDYGLAGCSSLEMDDLPTGLTDANDGAFSHTKLKNCTIPDGITSIGIGTFAACYSLSSLTIPDSVESIYEYAFIGCSGLSSVTIPDSVTFIDYGMFRNCTSLTAATIGSGLTEIDGMFFSGCPLTKLNSEINGVCNIPSGITSIGGSAFTLNQFEVVNIPSGVTTIGEDAFNQGDNEVMERINIAATTPPTLIAIGNTGDPHYNEATAFDNTNGCPIYVPCDSLNTYKTNSRWSKYADRLFGYGCIEYRWYPSGTTCIEYDKYQNNIRQVNSGGTWENVIPEQYSASTLIEECSSDCGWTGGTKWLGHYAGGITNSAECDCHSSSIGIYEIPKSNLEDIEIGDCVTTLDNSILFNATSLTSATLSDSIVNIGGWTFEGCFNLKQVTLPSNITYISKSMFDDCYSLSSITIPNSVTSIGDYAFNSCSALTEVTIPDNVATIGKQVFQNCKALESVTIGSGVTSIGNDTFAYCSNLTGVTFLSPKPPTLGNSNVFYNVNCPLIVPCEYYGEYLQAGQDRNNTWYHFRDRITPSTPGCTAYRWVPSGYTCVGYNKYQNSILQSSTGYNPTAITEVVWENVTPAQYSATTLLERNSMYCGYTPTVPSGTKWIAYYDDGTSASTTCSTGNNVIAQKEIPVRTNRNIVGGIDLSTVLLGNCVTEIGNNAFDIWDDGYTHKAPYAFSNILLNNGLETIGDVAFRGCSGLTSVNIPNTVTSIGYGAFSACTSLTGPITIPSGVTTINWGLFHSCTSLDSVTLPSGITAINEYAFYYCSNLSSVNLPDSVQTIGVGAFMGCRSLAGSLVLPSDITSIDSGAFKWCSSLTSVVIPSGITSIGSVAFEGCGNLESITIYATTPPALGNGAFNNTKNCPIYVPAESVSAYQSEWYYTDYDYPSRILPITNS